jgi:hypothetical protein
MTDTTIDAKKVMFEIYRDAGFGGTYKVVYFTELGEHDKAKEIDDAMRGDHVFDGFLLYRESQQAKRVVSEILDRLNRGESVDMSAIETQLKPFLV